MNWVIENIKNPKSEICDLIETRMNEIILKTGFCIKLAVTRRE